MCGFAGFAGPGGERDLAAMTTIIRHRGPDDDGVYANRTGPLPVHLGFRRLAIIDIEGGHQPMATTEGDLVIVYNGEIYNAPELRHALEQAGHRFVTDHSDTEVLLHGYREWGLDMLERLNGMFAFCLHDHRRNRLVFGRDRFGKKPLFYAETAEGLVFASEATAVLSHPTVSDALDQRALMKYFAYGFIPAPLTAHKAVRKLPGGCSMIYDLHSRALSVNRYWEYRMVVDDPPPGGPDAWAEELRDLLDRAVERRMLSDVPVGFFLSGGIDSAAIVALAARHRDPASMKTFTIGFDEPSFDESGYAAEAARHYGTDHACRTLNLDTAAGLLPDLLGRLDDPIADPSILPTHLLSRFARERVTVALTGDGGDELFAGYDTFDALGPARLYHSVMPAPLHRLAEAAAHRLPRSDRNMSFDFKLRRALRGLGHRPAHWMPSWLAPASVEEVGRLFGVTVSADDLYEEADALWNSGASRHDVDRSIEFYGRFYLGENLLIKADRASMFCSLETRSPFLDRDLVAFVSRLPASAKLRPNGPTGGLIKGSRKWILKKAMAPLLPPSILARPKKGFGIPLSRWLRHLLPPATDTAARIGMDGAWLSARWDEHRGGRADHRGLLWAWTALAATIDRPTLRHTARESSVDA
ncbi:asparagine synthase (glutamine-hydrolyzing) [Azospirillum griseum]|uniref:asparagine synthase (glutamine-hydrolyzing) n=1 Tax=Azospirillum griseum TaxID=2496639 RepID=A0A431VAH4_9PROT|nr:asparagine synthase (glutamine-hydrolyzing) [Azospirillum griseum]RTR13833.1 asparagine synthase (glutamine-hydrolyzing) [Azospirillum griseum]